ncbi:MAG TPA: aldehyde dehydrogenase family protein, partial [Phycisphaerae bacterium]|nr:aldehyde dehydrogenase family protein [Phycisphaerae bacterium]
MTQLSDQQIDAIAQQVLGRLAGRAAGAAPAPAETDAFGREVLGVFAEIDSAVAAANEAFKQLDKLPLSKRDAIIANIRKRMLENAEMLASEAHRETGLGRVA